MGNLLVNIVPGIVETLPDGKTFVRPVRATTLESTDPATDKISKNIIRAKTAGDASLEISIEQTCGMFFIGSRVLDPGILINPNWSSVTAVFPNVNPPAKVEKAPVEGDERDAKRAAKTEAEAAEDKLKAEGADLKWTDVKTQKLTLEKSVDAGSAEITITVYGSRKFFLTASANSAMRLSIIRLASLSEGFSIQWSPDPDKNKDGKTRLALEVR